MLADIEPLINFSFRRQKVIETCPSCFQDEVVRWKSINARNIHDKWTFQAKKLSYSNLMVIVRPIYSDFQAYLI